MVQIVPRMEVGGVERGVVDVARYFSSSHEEVIVVSGGGRLVSELKKEGVVHYTLNVHRKSPLTLLSIPRLRWIIKKEKPDIIHCRSRVPGWVGFFATRNTDTDFITTAHGKYSPHFFSKVMAWGKFVICPSKVIARHMQDKFDVGEDKIIIIPRWVDLDSFKFVPYSRRGEKVTILSVGRISPSKGYEYLIEAMRRVVRTDPYVNLKIVGDVSSSHQRYFNYLKSMVQRYSLNYNIKFVGYRKDIPLLLSSAHLLVAPSVVEESFGRVIIESFACGTPVIASRLGAFPEIIEDKKTGILVPPRDPQSLSDAILKVLQDRPFAERMTVAARKTVEEKFSAYKCIGKLQEIYHHTRRFKRILVVKLSSLGDVILIIPSLRAIKEAFPSCSVSLLTLKEYTPLFYGCPYLDKVIGVDRTYKKLPSILSIARKLRCAGYDYIVDFQNNRASHLISFLSFPRKSFGFSRKLGFLLSHRASFPRDKSVDPLSSQERILKLMGVEFKQKELTFWKVSEREVSLLDRDFYYVGINVSASKRWETKNWPAPHIIKLVEMIHSRFPSFRVVLVGDKDAKEIADRIEASFRSKVINLCGRTSLRELVEVISRFSVFVTPDTASLHLAQSLGVPTIALFGPTNPSAHTVPSKNLEVIYKKIDCSFCYQQRCVTHRCMEEISPREVFARLRRYLEDVKKRKSDVVAG